MMKKALFMLAMLTCILAGCSGGGNDEPINPTPKPEEVKAEITLDSSIVSNGLSFGVASGEQIVSFSANTNWTLSVASTTSGATWCKASATSGSKGNATVKFTIDENTSYDDRSVSVTIKAGTACKTFTITQKGADALLVTTNKYEVAQEGGKIEVEVKANINYELTISETAKDWITESKSRALTTHKHTFEIALNEESEKREGEITFKSGDKVETVKVYQAGGAIILLSQNEYTVNDAGETISVDIKSNVEYGVQMPDVDWIADEVSSRGMSSHTLKYVISPNEGYDARSAGIIFYDKNSDLKDTLKVIQAQKDAIVISEKNFSISKDGGTIEVKVNTNVDFEVQIPSDITWVSQADSRTLSENSIYLKIEENKGDNTRETEIVFINNESQISESITISQAGSVKAGYANGVVTIATAGTMKKLLGDDYLNITSLKVVGPINGDDVLYLRMMLGCRDYSQSKWGRLTTLDLSEATIVEGGVPYYLDNYNTSKNVIGDYMFNECTNLQNIILPDNIISIGRSAFEYCSNLTSIFIGDNVSSISKEAFYGCRGLIEVTISNGEVGPYAFYNCENLTYLTIGNGVTTIAEYAFDYCFDLTNIIIGKGIVKIGICAFPGYGMRDDINVYIKDLSAWCKIDFDYGDSNPLWNAKNVYINNKLITELVIPDDITEIKAYAFFGCEGFTKVVFHDNVTNIGYRSFRSCNNITNLVLGKGISSINSEAFAYAKIKECYCYAVNPPKTGSYVFYEMENKATLYVPEGCGAKYESTWGNKFDYVVEMD